MLQTSVLPNDCLLGVLVPYLLPYFQFEFAG